MSQRSSCATRYYLLTRAPAASEYRSVWEAHKSILSSNPRCFSERTSKALVEIFVRASGLPFLR